jgi:cell division protein FtsB
MVDLLPRLLPIAMLATALVSVPWMILGPEGLPRMHSLEDELSTIQAQNTDRKREIVHLRAEVRSLREDPSSIEHIARGQLGMVRKSEVVFQFPRSSQ